MVYKVIQKPICHYGSLELVTKPLHQEENVLLLSITSHRTSLQPRYLFSLNKVAVGDWMSWFLETLIGKVLHFHNQGSGW